MDANGLVPEGVPEEALACRAEGRRVKFTARSPATTAPAGGGRRSTLREILRIAQEAGVLVLEDDPYGLLGFGEGPRRRSVPCDLGRGLPRLVQQDHRCRSAGSAGRAPHAVRRNWCWPRGDPVSVELPQLTVSEYLRTQPRMDQVKAFRELYRERRDALHRDGAAVPKDVGTVPTGGFYRGSRFRRDRRHGHAAGGLPNWSRHVPGTGFYVDGQGRDSMRLSYRHPTPERISEGVRRLAGVIESELELIHTFGNAPVHSPGTRHVGPGPGLGRFHVGSGCSPADCPPSVTCPCGPARRPRGVVARRRG